MNNYSTLSTVVNGNDQYGKLSHMDIELFIVFDNNTSQEHVSFLATPAFNYFCQKQGHPESGQQVITNFGAAEINGKFIKFEILCTGTYSSNSIYWTAEVQPKTQAGADFILHELLEQNDLKIKFDYIQMASTKFFHTVINSDFTEQYVFLMNRKNAL